MSFHVVDAALPLAGGALIGGAAALHLATHGRIAGISGIVSGILERAEGWAVRVAFSSGMVGGGALLAAWRPDLFEGPSASLLVVALAGVLVGFGTRLGNGCTSGHGVCGVSRLSGRSIAATIVFVAMGVVTVTLGRRFGVGG